MPPKISIGAFNSGGSSSALPTGPSGAPPSGPRRGRYEDRDDGGRSGGGAWRGEGGGRDRDQGRQPDADAGRSDDASNWRKVESRSGGSRSFGGFGRQEGSDRRYGGGSERSGGFSDRPGGYDRPSDRPRDGPMRSFGSDRRDGGGDRGYPSREGGDRGYSSREGGERGSGGGFRRGDDRSGGDRWGGSGGFRRDERREDRDREDRGAFFSRAGERTERTDEERPPEKRLNLISKGTGAAPSDPFGGAKPKDDAKLEPVKIKRTGGESKPTEREQTSTREKQQEKVGLKKAAEKPEKPRNYDDDGDDDDAEEEEQQRRDQKDENEDEGDRRSAAEDASKQWKPVRHFEETKAAVTLDKKAPKLVVAMQDKVAVTADDLASGLAAVDLGREDNEESLVRVLTKSYFEKTLTLAAAVESVAKNKSAQASAVVTKLLVALREIKGEKECKEVVKESKLDVLSIIAPDLHDAPLTDFLTAKGLVFLAPVPELGSFVSDALSAGKEPSEILAHISATVDPKLSVADLAPVLTAQVFKLLFKEPANPDFTVVEKFALLLRRVLCKPADIDAQINFLYGALNCTEAPKAWWKKFCICLNDQKVVNPKGFLAWRESPIKHPQKTKALLALGSWIATIQPLEKSEQAESDGDDEDLPQNPNAEFKN